MDKLHVAFAVPDDPALDSFESGVREVDEYVRGRLWFNTKKNKASPPTYQFSTTSGGDVAGYAAAAFRRSPHPDDASDRTAKYLVIYVAGVQTTLQGQPNPRDSGRTFAASIFDVLERLASEKDGCVGLSLWVRADNGRAIRFYEKFGFVSDPGGSVQRDDGAPHLTMRKLL